MTTKKSALSMTGRPRGRPSAQRAAALDQLVIDTARRKFLNDGFEAVALEAVAAEAGISKGTLYARHASKEALFLAVWEDAVGKWSAAAARNDHLLGDDIAQRLLHHARTIAGSLLDEETRAFQRIIYANLNRFPTIAREIHNLGFRYIASIVARDIAEASAREGLPVRDPSTAAEVFISSINGWMIQNSTVRQIEEKEAMEFAAKATGIFLEGRAAW
ncbi:TetR/AcrR family transcriptional regulator [Parafrankia sp. BMG5.11]|uniref:TetR/AcrR family transcriptional regulator n=1 Tax=Parafrankia sp. BMG5.11 TaxID=222540 RepID=UPI00103F6D39|nr:TetR/AcrR family transcriptional regulator [Parafrankia sp. BMG5.11]TCJ37064.1 TetR/AcrR family transcriptional regulator [Parafrankia sp. BMG5.11]